uniref:ISL LIM homeobox 2 n=1 Tax=Latimeria chalumnae TaxID=7897 RepID=H3ARN3_LATCH
SGDIFAGPVPVCVGCGEVIKDPFLLHVSPNLDWHAACLRCDECNCSLDETSTCFLKEGKIYCRTDYFRVFAQKCIECHKDLLSSDLVLRAQSLVYHQHCFCCIACKRQLLPGEEYTLQQDGLYCQAHQQLAVTRLKEETQPAPKCRTKSLPLSGANSNIISVYGCQKQQEEKLTRVRTVLSEQQLQALRACYAVNPRPDALLKERLVEITGLNSRVIRVWFQNKRCKDKKRSLMAKESDQYPDGKKTLQGFTGIRMVARSPEPQEEDFFCSLVNIQSYESPWQSLINVSVQFEMEKTSFRQMVCLS